MAARRQRVQEFQPGSSHRRVRKSLGDLPYPLLSLPNPPVGLGSCLLTESWPNRCEPRATVDRKRRPPVLGSCRDTVSGAAKSRVTWVRLRHTKHSAEWIAN